MPKNRLSRSFLSLIRLFSLFFIFPLALRTAKVIYYAPVAPFGADAILDNRKLEIKENYNSYNEIKRGIVLIVQIV